MTSPTEPALTESTPADMAKKTRKDDKVNWGEEVRGAALLLAEQFPERVLEPPRRA